MSETEKFNHKYRDFFSNRKAYFPKKNYTSDLRYKMLKIHLQKEFPSKIILIIPLGFGIVPVTSKTSFP